MQWTRELDEAGTVRLAELIALKIRPGDVVALVGDLGAGKTTLARALIGALLGETAPEVPSPTFALQQTYPTSRLTVSHFDLYRLASADEARELGLEEALETGAAIVEWPERAASLLPDDRIEVVLAETADPDRRRVTVRGLGSAAARVARSNRRFRRATRCLAGRGGGACGAGILARRARGTSGRACPAPRRPGRAGAGAVAAARGSARGGSSARTLREYQGGGQRLRAGGGNISRRSSAIARGRRAAPGRRGRTASGWSG